jgi:outer membrane autotransporter protein
VFLFNADLAAARDGINPAGTVANHLHIANVGTGAHTVVVNPSGTPVAMNLSIELITTGTGAPDFMLPHGRLESGLIVLELLQGNGTPYTPDAHKLYLTATAGLSHTADAILGTASSLALDWAHSLDALHQRMGEVRAENLRGTGDSPVDGAPRRQTSTSDSNSTGSAAGNVWVRTRGYRLDASNAITGLGYRQYGYGATGGLDKAFSLGNGVNLLGGFVDMGAVNREFDNHGKGDTRDLALGAYFTHLTPGGWYADLVARVDRYKNSFEARAVDGSVTTGRYTSNAQSVSLELGRRLQRADGWWLEPAVQAAVLWLNDVAYDTDRTPSLSPIHVDVGNTTLAQYRAQVRFGRRFRDSRWYPYGKLAAVAVDSDGGEVAAQGRSLRPDYDGDRVEFGFGTMWRINDLSQMYLDYEYARAARYERPWSINLGYRRQW